MSDLVERICEFFGYDRPTEQPHVYVPVATMIADHDAAQQATISRLREVTGVCRDALAVCKEEIARLNRELSDARGEIELLKHPYGTIPCRMPEPELAKQEDKRE